MLDNKSLQGRQARKGNMNLWGRGIDLCLSREKHTEKMLKEVG